MGCAYYFVILLYTKRIREASQLMHKSWESKNESWGSEKLEIREVVHIV